MKMDNVQYPESLLWQTFWDNTEKGILLVAASGEIEKCNQSCEKILGQNVEKMPLTDIFKVTGLQTLFDDEAIFNRNFIPYILDDGNKNISWYLQDQLRGNAFYADIKIHSLRDESQEIIGAILIIKDISAVVLQEQNAEHHFEKLVRESEVVWDAIPDILLRISKDEIYLDIRASNQEDLIQPAEQLKGKNLKYSLRDKSVYSIWSDAMQLAFESQKLQTIGYALDFKDGKRYFEARIAPINEIEVVAVVRNITERWDAQRMIHEIENRFLTLIDAYPDILFRMSDDGTFLEIHAPNEEELVAPISELLGKRIQDTHSEFLINLWKEAKIQLRKTGDSQQVSYDLELNGDTYSFDSRMLDSAPNEVLIIIRNITDWKLAQKELQESESRFRSMAEALTNPVMIIKRSRGSVLYANQRFYDALKLKNKDLVGKNIYEFFPDFNKRQELFERIRREGHLFDMEFEFIRPNGERFWMLFSANPILYEGEKAIIASFVDITDWRISQAQLLQASKLASLGEMSAGIAHEINTPLATIRLSCFNAQTSWDNNDLNEAKANLDLIELEVERTSTIIRQMLHFSHNVVRDEWEVIDLRDTMTQILMMLRNQLEAAGVDVILKLGKKSLWVSGKTTQIQQVIYNLASNAKDAVLESKVKKIEFRMKRIKHYAVFEIEDTGTGITPEGIRSLFEPFYTTKPAGRGTGLGLSVSNTIVKAHNGFLEGKSKGLGKGAVFKMKLPLCLDHFI